MTHTAIVDPSPPPAKALAQLLGITQKELLKPSGRRQMKGGKQNARPNKRLATNAPGVEPGL